MPFTAGHCGRKNIGVSVVGGSKKVERWALGERGGGDLYEPGFL